MAKVEVSAARPAARRRVIHLCDWHYVSPEHLAADPGSDDQQAAHIEDVRAVQAELRQVIEALGVTAIYHEGVTDENLPDLQHQLAALMKFKPRPESENPIDQLLATEYQRDMVKIGAPPAERKRPFAKKKLGVANGRQSDRLRNESAVLAPGLSLPAWNCSKGWGVIRSLNSRNPDDYPNNDITLEHPSRLFSKASNRLAISAGSALTPKWSALFSDVKTQICGTALTFTAGRRVRSPHFVINVLQH